MNTDYDSQSLAGIVYEELKRRLNEGLIRPGQFIDLTELGRELSMSRTPLRDALIRLELEGFVNIYPRRGVMVKGLGLGDIRDIYEVIGALEAATAESAAHKFQSEDAARMAELCGLMESSIAADDFASYYTHNLEFHDVYLCLSDNHDLVRDVRTRKERLYDFPRRGSYVKDWELSSNVEHRKICELFAARDFSAAAAYIKNVHWSYEVQERFIRRYYIEATGTGR